MYIYIDIVVIVYIYLTRIGIDLLEAALPYNYLWIAPCTLECITLLFYLYTGLQFKPSIYDSYEHPEEEEEQGVVEGSAVAKGIVPSYAYTSHAAMTMKDIELGVLEVHTTEEEYASKNEYGLATANKSNKNDSNKSKK